MSDAASPAPQLITELKVSAHVMQLDAGVYCVYSTPGSAPPDPATGLPGTRLSLLPGQANSNVTIGGFGDDGWLGSPDAAALIRITGGPASLLMTIYQDGTSGHAPPKLQVTKLVDGAASGVAAPPEAAALPAPARTAGAPPAADQAEIAAHLQAQGDVLGRLGEWVGDRGSQRWVEGFAISPRHPEIEQADIEYQAVLGRGWLSPWAEGGQYCGSRGMALPILGLRARLRGRAAETLTLEIHATFTDGTAIGPIGPGEPCEAESLAPLEAFCITVLPVGSEQEEPAGKRVSPARPMPGAARRPAPVAKAEPLPAAAKPPARGRRS